MLRLSIDLDKKRQKSIIVERKVGFGQKDGDLYYQTRNRFYKKNRILEE